MGSYAFDSLTPGDQARVRELAADPFQTPEQKVAAVALMLGKEGTDAAKRSFGQRILRAAVRDEDLRAPKPPGKEKKHEDAPVEKAPAPEPIERPSGLTFTRDGASGRISGSVARMIQTEEDLVRECQIDLTRWRIVKFRCTPHAMGYKNAEKKADWIQLFALSAEMVLKTEEINAREALTAVLDSIRHHAPHYPMIVPRPKAVTDGLLAEVGIVDTHFGKLCWVEETGNNYDLSAARRIFDGTIDRFAERLQGLDIGHIVLPVGHDCINFDGYDGATFGGTPQDNDGRYVKVVRTAIGCYRRAVEMLREIAPVTLLGVPGNHDRLSAWWVLESLGGIFERAPDVKIDNRPTTTKFFRYRQNLLMHTHGDKRPPYGYALKMLSEAPKDLLFETSYREVHLGHFHNASGKEPFSYGEYHGVGVRTLPSGTGNDAWHTESSWTKSNRASETYLYVPEGGIDSILRCNVEQALRIGDGSASSLSAVRAGREEGLRKAA